MIPDLGKYATSVLSAYAIAILLLIALTALSLLRARRVKKQLTEIESRRKNHG